MVRFGPGFGDFLKLARLNKKHTVRGLSTAAGLSGGTISPIESRRYARPSMPVVKSLAAVLDLPVIAAAIVAGYADSDIMETPWPKPRQAEYSHTGGAYLASLRTNNDFPCTCDTAAKRWTSQWGVPMSTDEWARLEQTGLVPASWQATGMDFEFLSDLPGPWLWGLLASIMPQASLSGIDLMGLAFMLGRIDEKLCQEWSAEPDLFTLDELLNIAHTRHSQSASAVDVATGFRHMLHNGQIQWTKANVVEKLKEALPDRIDDEQSLLTAYRALAADQKAAVRRIVQDLAQKRP